VGKWDELIVVGGIDSSLDGERWRFGKGEKQKEEKKNSQKRKKKKTEGRGGRGFSLLGEVAKKSGKAIEKEHTTIKRGGPNWQRWAKRRV